MPDQVYIEGIDDLLSLRPSDDAISAKKALLKIYDVIYEEAEKAARIFGDIAKDRENLNEEVMVKYCSHLFKIQQIICGSPLRYMLPALAEDHYLAIRIAAKGELVDHGNAVDEEAMVMANANLTVMCDHDMHTKMLAEVNNDLRIKDAMRLWSQATINSGFSPGT